MEKRNDVVDTKRPLRKLVLFRRIARRYRTPYRTDPYFRDVRHAGRRARRRGHFDLNGFLDVCTWKSSRPKKQYARNSASRVRTVTSAVLETKYEKRRMSKLCELYGVGVPVASAPLTALDPGRYGVIDIQAWQTLHWLGVVRKTPSGVNFTVADWIAYLFRLRYWAGKLRAPAQDLELSLYRFHADHLQGSRALYDARRETSGYAASIRSRKLGWLFGTTARR